MNRSKFGLVRVAAISHKVSVGNPKANADELLSFLDNSDDDLFSADIVLGQELGITGYTAANLFHHVRGSLVEQAMQQCSRIALDAPVDGLLVVGCPVPVENSLYNCAVVIHSSEIIGVIPKQNLPGRKEFYEPRWFRAANGNEPKEIEWTNGEKVPFGIDLLFKMKRSEACIGIEICEDGWMPIPPSAIQAMHGANILLNLSASNETVAKSDYRRNLFVSHSGRLIAAYAYASAGPSESSTDVVFGGHCFIAENGIMGVESMRVGDGLYNGQTYAVTYDVDVERLMNDRRVSGNFDEVRPIRREHRIIEFHGSRDRWLVSTSSSGKLLRKVDGQPFVPRDPALLHARCNDIFGIQTAGLIKRLSMLPKVNPVIGLSGGLDSALAILVAVKAIDEMGLPRSTITARLMKGFGTTSRTAGNGMKLASALGVTIKEDDIRPLAHDVFAALQHNPFESVSPDAARHTQFNGYFWEAKARILSNFQQALEGVRPGSTDLVFENVQARLRTLLLMNSGFVLGTGNMTELALGWATYNGDHMSMYNVNCSVPKTLVQFLVRHLANTEFSGATQDTLLDILATPVSPELLPTNGQGELVQTTESSIGSIELHDFFLFNFVRNSFSPQKIFYLSKFADFSQEYSEEQIRTTLRLFLTRFFGNQFKRSAVPDGPKVGTVSLSPRGDWRMASDSDVTLFLKDI